MCAAGQPTRATHEEGQCVLSIQNATQIDTLQKSDEEQWSAINALRNRLPVWVTALISVLTFFIGTLAGALTFALNYYSAAG